MYRFIKSHLTIKNKKKKKKNTNVKKYKNFICSISTKAKKEETKFRSKAGASFHYPAMQVLQTSYLFTFPKPLNPSPQRLHHRLQPFLHHRHRRPLTISKSFSSDEFPVDETFLENFGPKDKETEDEARRRNWIERGWAPWEEILTPEADFARKSLNEGEEVPLRSPEAIEAFKMLNPNHRKKKREEMGLTEEEFYAKQFEIKGEIPDPLVTTWAGPLVVRLVAPRDWPPRGWCVDREELAFIREAHRMQARRVRLEEVESGVRTDTDDAGLDRYKVFLKQYKEWVEANKDRLEVESYKVLILHHTNAELNFLVAVWIGLRKHFLVSFF